MTMAMQKLLVFQFVTKQNTTQTLHFKLHFNFVGVVQCNNMRDYSSNQIFRRDKGQNALSEMS